MAVSGFRDCQLICHLRRPARVEDGDVRVQGPHLSPMKVCSSVMMPDTKKMVQITLARSAGKTAAAQD
jgi:hypothetical protein